MDGRAAWETMGEPTGQYTLKGRPQVYWFYWQNGIRRRRVTTLARYTYVCYHGTIPRNMYVYNIDGNLSNCSISNLATKTKHQMLYEIKKYPDLPHRTTQDGKDERFCRQCGTWKELIHFSKRKQNRSKGLAPMCIRCSNARTTSRLARKRYQIRMRKQQRKNVCSL